MTDLFHATDLSLFYALNGLAGQAPFLDQIIVFCASYLAYVLIVAFVAYVLLSRHTKRLKAEILLTALTSAVVARFGIAEIIRFFYHRPRPFLTLDIQPLFTDPAWSFPSGHATFFFALATAMFLYDKRWGIGFYLAAGLVTLGRVAAGVHYPSDILFGALIGIAVAYTTFSLWAIVVPKLDPILKKLYNKP